MTACVLVVEDDATARELLVEVLQSEGYEVMAADSAAAAIELARHRRPHVMVSDLRLGAMDGIELMRQLQQDDPALQTIVVTAFGSLHTAIDAIHSGAFDYMSKPFSMDEVTRMVRRALEARQSASGVAVERSSTERTMVGRSAAMTRVYKEIASVAPLEASVLIEGETGTGKELVARAVHDAGPRAPGPYVAVNCPSLPEGLLEAELFGHVRGAFTGATADRTGLFETASGGTLLLDEIGDLPLPVQAKLLRVLETREFRPVGSSSVRTTNARVVAATHCDLERAVSSRRFREDLLYRLNTVTIRLPPLRERTDDIPLLVEYFLGLFASSATRGVPSITPPALASLRSYSWPGNVRELAHVLERAVALARGSRIGLEDLPAVVREKARSSMRPKPTSLQTLDEVEKAHVLSVLKSVGGARGRAAAILGVDRKTLYRKLLRYGLVEAEDENDAS